MGKAEKTSRAKPIKGAKKKKGMLSIFSCLLNPPPNSVGPACTTIVDSVE